MSRHVFENYVFTLLLASLVIATIAFPTPTRAQATVSTGSIQGTLLDPSGAVVTGAKITITNSATNQKTTVYSTGGGLYSSGALIPGDYRVRVEKPGFQTLEFPAVVQVGVITPGGQTLKPGAEAQTITVEASALQVNTQQATVQGVLNAQQIDNLPINGRNFLELAQLEPGVQIQEGGTFDPTKNGFSSISFGGRYGRTARIEIDGVDISDETVGTTTQNVPASAIQEFQLSQSTLDLSTELTSSGSVNITTRSGTNNLHGEGFYLFRSSDAAAALPGPPSPFQRNQFGGNLGGPIMKDKLFWFIDAERSKQDLQAPQPWPDPFTALSGNFGSPFREGETMGRLDWNIRGNARMFYRFTYDQNSDVRAYGSSPSFQPFKNRNYTPSHAVGVDFNTGSFTHSIRFEYLKFRNGIVDATNTLSGPSNPIPGLGLNIGAPVEGLCIFGGASFCSGPNFLAPQATFQSDHQVKYDGSKTHGSHIFRYGVAFNHLQGGGYATFINYPQVGTTFTMPGDSDPSAYPVQYLFIGSGIGFSSAKPSFGFPAGGLGPDNRFQLYVGDSWRLRPSFTLTAGLRYVRDTGRQDSELGPLPVLNQWGPGLGNAVRQPNTNFAPQLGFAWDVMGNGKTVVRGGGGLFYENAVWNNVLFDAPGRLAKGAFLVTPAVCFGGSAAPVTWPTSTASIGPPNTVFANGGAFVVDDSHVQANFCGGTFGAGETIAQAASQIFALSAAYQAASKATGGVGDNANFVGTNLAAGSAFNGLVLFDPNYRTPRSWQMNIGIQREIRPGTVLSVDYLRNIGLHFLLGIDANHTGAARYYSQANAIAARDAVQVAAGCPAGPGQAQCVINSQVPGAPLGTTQGQAGAQALYSTAGLDSANQTNFGLPCNFCAFPGKSLDGSVGQLELLEPIGRSVYNGLQVKLVHNADHLMRGVSHASFQVAYSLSRFVSQFQDQDFINTSTDMDRPLAFTGPNGLDRKHQFSFGGLFDLPFHTRVSLIGHFYSPLPANLTLPQLTSGGEIFSSDVTGDGTVGDVIPGSNIGSFERGINVGGLTGFVNNFNNTLAGQLTPAGKVVVNSGVMTQADMQALGWVIPSLPGPVPGALDFPWLKTFDFKLARPIKVGERFVVEPSVAAFNVFNIANSFMPGALPGGALYSGNSACGSPSSCITAGTIGGVNFAGLSPFRASIQSGTNALAAPREFEFGLRLTF